MFTVAPTLKSGLAAKSDIVCGSLFFCSNTKGMRHKYVLAHAGSEFDRKEISFQQLAD